MLKRLILTTVLASSGCLLVQSASAGDSADKTAPVPAAGSGNAETAAGLPKVAIDALGMIVLAETAGVSGGVNTGNGRTDFEIQRVWDDGSLYKISGVYRGRALKLEVRSLWSDKSEYAVSGTLGEKSVDIRRRDVWKDHSEYVLSGSIGGIAFNINLKDAWKDGALLGASGAVGQAKAEVSLRSYQVYDEKKVKAAGGSIGGRQVDLWAKKAPEKNSLLLGGSLGGEKLSLTITDPWADGTDIRISGSLEGAAGITVGPPAAKLKDPAEQASPAPESAAALSAEEPVTLADPYVDPQTRKAFEMSTSGNFEFVYYLGEHCGAEFLPSPAKGAVTCSASPALPKGLNFSACRQIDGVLGCCFYGVPAEERGMTPYKLAAAAGGRTQTVTYPFKTETKEDLAAVAPQAKSDRPAPAVDISAAKPAAAGNASVFKVSAESLALLNSLKLGMSRKDVAALFGGPPKPLVFDPQANAAGGKQWRYDDGGIFKSMSFVFDGDSVITIDGDSPLKDRLTRKRDEEMEQAGKELPKGLDWRKLAERLGLPDIFRITKEKGLNSYCTYRSFPQYYVYDLDSEGKFFSYRKDYGEDYYDYGMDDY